MRPIRPHNLLALGLSFVGLLATTAHASPPSPNFAKDVRPILEKSCYSCHGAEKQKAGLRLDVRASAMRGGESGPAFVPGKSDQSLVIKLTRGDDPDRIMPAKGDRLTATQISTIAAWIDAGAPWPDD